MSAPKGWGTAQVAMESMRRTRWEDGKLHPPQHGELIVLKNAANSLRPRGPEPWDGVKLDLDALFTVTD